MLEAPLDETANLASVAAFFDHAESELPLTGFDGAGVVTASAVVSEDSNAADSVQPVSHETELNAPTQSIAVEESIQQPESLFSRMLTPHLWDASASALLVTRIDEKFLGSSIEFNDELATGFRARIGRDHWSILPGSDRVEMATTHIQGSDEFVASTVRFDYESALNSVQVNSVYGHDSRRPFDILAGLRFTRLSDHLVGLNASAERMNVESSNNLFGLQIGARGGGGAGPFELAVGGNFGAAINRLHLELQQYDQGVLTESNSASDSKMSLYWDANLEGRYRIADSWRLAMGLQALYFYTTYDLLVASNPEEDETWRYLGGYARIAHRF